MTWKPRVTVATVVEKDGRFLCIEEWQNDCLVLNQPAGHLELGESLADAAIRETLEETGWHIEVASVIGVYLWQPSPDKDSFLRVTFHAHALSHDEERTLDTGIERALWLTEAEIMARRAEWRTPVIETCLHDYLAGQCHPLGMLKFLNEFGELIA